MSKTAYQAYIQVARERFEALDTKTAQKTRDPLQAPVSLLGHLGWSRGLDYWGDWTEAEKRALINQAPANLRIRGTRQAINNALEAFSQELTIEEWWEQTPEGVPGTATVTAPVGATLLENQESQALVVRLLARESRKSIHWTLILGVDGECSIGDEARLRVTSLYQFSGEQSGA